jgi:hypothetical protein
MCDWVGNIRSVMLFVQIGRVSSGSNDCEEPSDTFGLVLRRIRGGSPGAWGSGVGVGTTVSDVRRLGGWIMIDKLI